MTFICLWVLAAVATWIAVMMFTDFVLWSDDSVAIVVGMIFAAFLCAMFWPFVCAAWIGKALHR